MDTTAFESSVAEPSIFLLGPDPRSRNSDPRSKIIKDPTGSESYLDIFVHNEKICFQIGTLVNH